MEPDRVTLNGAEASGSVAVEAALLLLLGIEAGIVEGATWVERGARELWALWARRFPEG